MNHKNLSVKKRYIIFFITLFCLLLLGGILLKAWNQTPETHFVEAINLIEKDQTQKAVKHLILAQKSQDTSIKKISGLYLGRIYYHGLDTISPDIRKAIYYYEQAAAFKSGEALYTLALIYDAGTKVPQDQEKAKQYMVQAAQILPEAQYAMAVWIERGYFGKPDMAQAVKLYENAARAGINNAVKSLIAIYHGGYGGFPNNIQKEQYWRTQLK